MPDRAVVALDVGVLLGLTGLDVLDRDAQFISPDQQLATDVFRKRCANPTFRIAYGRLGLSPSISGKREMPCR